MRNRGVLLWFLVLACGRIWSAALLAAVTVSSPLEPAAEPQVTSTLTTTPQGISVGEEVTGMLNRYPCCPPMPVVTELLFELTAPADGTLFVHLSYDPISDIGLFVEDDAAVSYWPYTTSTVPVVAGGTYRIWVSVNPWNYFPDVPFVLTTSLVSGSVAVPVGCTFAPPVSDWICVTGGWVPPDHPLAEGGAAPPEPPPPSAGTTGCPTIQPASTWVCVNGGWLPPDHPSALSAPSSPTPPSPPSAPTACTTPDPFIGIPRLIGVCLGGNNWVPMGHPLAGGGEQSRRVP